MEKCVGMARTSLDESLRGMRWVEEKGSENNNLNMPYWEFEDPMADLVEVDGTEEDRQLLVYVKQSFVWRFPCF